MPVAHVQIYKPSAFGGTKNTTLCGRLASGEDMNIADRPEDVTCKLCLRRLTAAPVKEIKAACKTCGAQDLRAALWGTCSDCIARSD